MTQSRTKTTPWHSNSEHRVAPRASTAVTLVATRSAIARGNSPNSAFAQPPARKTATARSRFGAADRQWSFRRVVKACSSIILLSCDDDCSADGCLFLSSTAMVNAFISFNRPSLKIEVRLGVAAANPSNRSRDCLYTQSHLRFSKFHREAEDQPLWIRASTICRSLSEQTALDLELLALELITAIESPAVRELLSVNDRRHLETGGRA